MSLTSRLVLLIKERPIRQDDFDQAALLFLDAMASCIAGAYSDPGSILLNWAHRNGLFDDAHPGGDARYSLAMEIKAGRGRLRCAWNFVSFLLIVLFLGFQHFQPGFRNQRNIIAGIVVICGEKPIAVKDGIGAGKKA